MNIEAACSDAEHLWGNARPQYETLIPDWSYRVYSLESSDFEILNYSARRTAFQSRYLLELLLLLYHGRPPASVKGVAIF
jgi:hypothetical protein